MKGKPSQTGKQQTNPKENKQNPKKKSEPFENKSYPTEEAAIYPLKESIHMNSEFSTWHCFSRKTHFPAETLHRTFTFLTRRVYSNE